MSLSFVDNFVFIALGSSINEIIKAVEKFSKEIIE